MSDPELLQRYTQHGSQEAFAVLVSRHLDLVYSAARRQVRSSQLADEVAQSVFLDLSLHAHQMKPGTPLIAWLYLVTRRTALNVVRRESRRQAREKTAFEIAAMNSSTPAWPQVEPLLDEAMESLDDTDRSAVLLRYFENQSLREVGQSLGTSEDAAQKRVSRAVDQLRTFFLRRGVAVTAAGLATDLSANAIQTAPAALKATIAVGGAALSHSAITTATDLVMTTTQKTLLTATIALALGGTLYEAHSIDRQTGELQLLQSTAADLRREIAGLQQQNGMAKRALASTGQALAAARAPVTPAEPGSDAALDAEMAAWMARAARLKQLIAERPDLTIPEMQQYLTDEALFTFAGTAKLETDEQSRETLSRLRQSAKNTLGNKMPVALRAYLAAHDNELPADPQELGPYFNPPIDPAILQRYAMSATGKLDDVPSQRRNVYLIEEKSAVDDFYDSRLTVGTQGLSLGSFDPIAGATRQAMNEFNKANQGSKPTDPIQLLPYFNPPLRPADQQKFIQNPDRYLSH